MKRSEHYQLSRRQKRAFVVPSRENEVRIIDYVDRLAITLSQKFPKQISYREAYKQIYTAFMKDGKPEDAKKEATTLLRNCQLNSLKGWHRKLWFRIVFRWLTIKQYVKKQEFV